MKCCKLQCYSFNIHVQSILQTNDKFNCWHQHILQNFLICRMFFRGSYKKKYTVCWMISFILLSFMKWPQEQTSIVVIVYEEASNLHFYFAHCSSLGAISYPCTLYCTWWLANAEIVCDDHTLPFTVPIIWISFVNDHPAWGMAFNAVALLLLHSAEG